MSWIAGIRARLRLLLGRASAEARMDEEIRFHLEMETRKNLALGMSPGEARRRAVLAFGGVETHREVMREGRGLAWVPGSLLDFKLGLRMLAKYPGLTLVGTLGMAVAIAIGAGSFEVIYAIMDADPPLDEGDRVVAVQVADAAIGNPERRILYDFAVWREEVRSLEDLGAFRTSARNLIGPDGSATPIPVAEMTASGFRVARVPPLLGRPLLDEDERAGAPPVVVIGYREWRTRFEGDPGVVGRTLQLGRVPHTVVGVMPEGFAFPVNHRFWVPLRADPAQLAPREGAVVYVFGRLAPGVTPERAQAEMAAIGRRTAAAHPDTHERLRPVVLPYTHPFTAMDEPIMAWLMHVTQLLVSMLLVVVAVNVAILVYARTATRQGEIAVRSALGASRRRIVAQLFVEALVLSAAAAAVGLLIVRFVLASLRDPASRMVADAPFWIDFRLSPGTVLYAVGLAVVGAVIVGVIPALKVTGGRMQASLRQLGGGTGVQLGRTWTVLIVAQVAVAVAALPVATAMGWNEFLRAGVAGPGSAAEEILTARVALGSRSSGGEAEGEESGAGSRLADRQAELLRRLEAEPGVAEVTFAARLPGEEFSASMEIEAERPGVAPALREERFMEVDPDFFGALDAEIVAGRSLGADDLAGRATAVVVNRTFVRRVLGGGSALGRRIRYTRTEDRLEPGDVPMGEWYEIAGIVEDVTAGGVDSGAEPAIVYHPAAAGRLNPMRLILRLQGAAPAVLGGRLREIALAVDPDLRVDAVLTVAQIHREGERMRRSVAIAIAVVTLSVLLLSAAGIHAMLSFTVTRRRREIGIRSALGALPGRVLTGIFSRALRQLALGVALGVAAAALLDQATGGLLMGGTATVLLPGIAALMLLVGLLAALGPARRGLRIQPMEALREE